MHSHDDSELIAGLTRRQLVKMLCAAPLLTSVSTWGQPAAKEAGSGLDFASPDPKLMQSFRWAKQQALSYVFDNDPVGLWYEASLPGRQAFCMRDTAHQADGAQALGLARYNHNMLRRFAENISVSRDWCSYWEIDRSNRPAPVDYQSDAKFWYNLPANFDVLEACYRMYLWTGDSTYVEDPVFLNFYDRTMNEYVARWSLSPEHIMQRTSDIQEPPFFRGDPTYEESTIDNLVGIDLLATQLAAYRAYAVIQVIRGNRTGARVALQTASQVQALIEDKWWNSSEGFYYAFFDKNHRFTGHAGSELLYRDAAGNGPKAESALKTMLAASKTEPYGSVEAKSHYAETYYRYGERGAAYAQILDLCREGRDRREYPEVSYSVIGALVTGMMGIRVQPIFSAADMTSGKPFRPVVETLSRLNGPTEWAEVRGLPIHNSLLTVRHEGNRSTRVTNNGKDALNWKAIFAGSFKTLSTDGKPTTAQVETAFLQQAISSTMVVVPPGHTIEVKLR